MPDRRSAESYGHADEYEDEYEDWDEQEALETVPEWLAALPQEDFELMSRGYLADIRGRFRVQGRIALEAERLQGEMELPPDRPGMTQAEEELYRIAMAAGRAAGEFVDESLRRHHDPDNPLRIDPTETHRVRDENDLETWRDQSILGLLQYCVQEARAGHTEQYGFAVMTGEAIECIREAVQDTPLVEIGAGNGWLARELNERGISVHPTDPAEIQRNDHALGGREHMPVERLDGFQALAKYPDHDLLWSWPQMHGYVPEVMKRFQGKAPGLHRRERVRLHRTPGGHRGHDGGALPGSRVARPALLPGGERQPTHPGADRLRAGTRREGRRRVPGGLAGAHRAGGTWTSSWPETPARTWPGGLPRQRPGRDGFPGSSPRAARNSSASTWNSRSPTSSGAPSATPCAAATPASGTSWRTSCSGTAQRSGNGRRPGSKSWPKWPSPPQREILRREAPEEGVQE